MLAAAALALSLYGDPRREARGAVAPEIFQQFWYIEFHMACYENYAKLLPRELLIFP